MLKFLVSIFLFLLGCNLTYSQTHHRMIKYAGPLSDTITERFAAVWGYTRPDGREYAVIGARQAIRIFDITNPRNPIKVFNQKDLGFTWWREFKTYRNYIYGVCDNCSSTSNQGLFILHMDSLSTGAMRKQVDHFSDAHNLYIDTTNARLYVVGAKNIPSGSSAGIYIYSLANPAVPSLLKWHNTGRYSHDIFVRNNIVYSSEGNSGTFIYDMNDVNNISQIGSTSIRPGYHHSVWLTDDNKYMYSAREVLSGLPANQPLAMTHYNLVNNSPVNPVDYTPVYDNVVSLAIPHNPHLFKEKLYVSYYQDGVVVFDVSTPNQPTTMAYYDTFHPNTSNIKDYNGAWGVFPYFNSGTVLASDITYGLYVLGLVSEIEHSEDIILDTPGAGFLLTHHNGVSKISVNNFGGIVVTNTSSSGTAIKSKDADIKSQKDIVLRSPDGNYFKLEYNSGILTTKTYTSVPANVIRYNGDFLFEQSRGPLYKEANSNQWHRLKIDLNQNLTFFNVY